MCQESKDASLERAGVRQPARCGVAVRRRASWQSVKGGTTQSRHFLCVYAFSPPYWFMLESPTGDCTSQRADTHKRLAAGLAVNVPYLFDADLVTPYVSHRGLYAISGGTGHMSHQMCSVQPSKESVLDFVHQCTSYPRRGSDLDSTSWPKMSSHEMLDDDPTAICVDPFDAHKMMLN